MVALLPFSRTFVSELRNTREVIQFRDGCRLYASALSLSLSLSLFRRLVRLFQGCCGVTKAQIKQKVERVRLFLPHHPRPPSKGVCLYMLSNKENVSHTVCIVSQEKETRWYPPSNKKQKSVKDRKCEHNKPPTTLEKRTHKNLNLFYIGKQQG